MTSPSATSSRKQVAYLAGPMRGIPEYNFPAFYAAAADLRKHGLDVWSPAEHDVNQDGFDPAKDTAQPMKHYMRRDLPAVLEADMVCVLPGWEKSQGATLEVHVAQMCGIPVYNAHDFSPVSTVSETPPKCSMGGGCAHRIKCKSQGHCEYPASAIERRLTDDEIAAWAYRHLLVDDDKAYVKVSLGPVALKPSLREMIEDARKL